jgi:hypothetical protein
MKHFLYTIIVIIVIPITVMCQIKKDCLDKDKSLSRENNIEKCKENPDNLYNRQKILEQLANLLSSSIPKYKKYFPDFYVENESAGGFFIYDLTDISNKDISTTDCIKFQNNHVYHFSPYYIPFSFSHILILEDGNLKIFKSINCEGKGDRLEDVVTYLNEKLKDDKNKDEIISRVKNYRKYGSYWTDDDVHVYCEDVGSSEK